jgi:hypothetical protein
MVRKIKQKVEKIVARGRNILPKRKFASLEKIKETLKKKREARQAKRKLRKKKWNARAIWEKNFEGSFSHTMQTAVVLIRNRKKKRKKT